MGLRNLLAVLCGGGGGPPAPAPREPLTPQQVADLVEGRIHSLPDLNLDDPAAMQDLVRAAGDTSIRLNLDGLVALTIAQQLQMVLQHSCSHPGCVQARWICRQFVAEIHRRLPAAAREIIERNFRQMLAPATDSANAELPRPTPHEAGGDCDAAK
ncbi:MAG: hypothetical protein ABSG68_24290 [Thermoguttaceae bacterium]|jgi:hypothetical protein